MRRSVALLAVLVGCLGAAACSPATLPKVAAQTLAASAAPRAVGSGEGSALAEPVNDFGFDLLRVLDAEKGRRPQTVISPLSIHADLAMVANGADKTTLAEMRRALHLGKLSETASNEAYAALLRRLNASRDVTMSVANSLWIDNAFQVKQAFLDADTRFFGAEIHQMPLTTQEAFDAMNAWASKWTHGRITKALDQIPPSGTQLVAINATYFDGKWATPFHPDFTQPAAFAAPSGTTQVPMMNGDAGTEYASGPGWEAARLPYVGGDYSMLVILPSKSSSLDALEASLTAQKFSAMRQALHTESVDISIPRVELRWNASLTDELEQLGMASAFSPNGANLSRIGGAPGAPFISDVFHKTYLRVDEKGTEAAAVTGIAVSGHAAIRSLSVDRPYLMAVVDDRTGTILFLAAVRDPRS